MIKTLLFSIIFSVFSSGNVAAENYAIVIHGGAGTINRGDLTPELEQGFHSKLTEATLAGNKVLASGGSSLDAVVAAMVIMEDSPMFNAGKGAAYTHDGIHALDASIMTGNDLNAGAVAGVKDVRNPILLAREVMEHSRHVLLSGEGASEFAVSRGLEIVSPDYFDTEFRHQQLLEALESEREKQAALSEDPVAPHKYGTVGAVALDKHGNLAAGTSTGGMTNKRFGRIGDSPIVGAGTYANNSSCAVSATGHGEYFIRYTVAHDICARMQYQGISLDDAAHAVIMETLVEAGGDGGIIAIDSSGNINMTFNTVGMYRAFSVNGEKPVTRMYRDE
jgi:beta-aspartyl-peptidase (threonine type)